ncbi:MAG: T9SS type A sorting domain-containing protein [Bacteroidota bacterium]
MKKSILLTLTLCLCVTLQSQIAFVGNMFPAAGSTSMEMYDPANPSSLTVYIQVYSAGVTEPAGQGAGIICEVYYGEVTNFGDTWMSINTVPMTYNVDIGNNDEYQGSIPIASSNNIEFTCRCSDDGGTNWVFADLGAGGNGRIEVEAVLPLELMRFNILEKENHLVFHWATSNEIAVSHFELEQSNSLDGQWNRIGKVNANNSFGEQHYQLDVPTPNLAKSYYRLKMLDQDGSYAYSGIQSFEQELMKPIIRVRSNAVEITDLNAFSGSFTMLSASGQVIAQQVVEEVQSIEWAGALSSGMYIIQLQGASGNNVLSTKIMIP